MIATWEESSNTLVVAGNSVTVFVEEATAMVRITASVAYDCDGSGGLLLRYPTNLTATPTRPSSIGSTRTICPMYLELGAKRPEWRRKLIARRMPSR